MTTKLVYKLLQRNERTVKPVKVSSIRRGKFLAYARVLKGNK